MAVNPLSLAASSASRGCFYAWKTKPHPSPWVLNYSINNAASAIPSPKRAAAMTWLPDRAPASPPSFVGVGGTRSPDSRARGSRWSQHPPSEPDDVTAWGSWGSPKSRMSNSIIPKDRPESRMSTSICMAPKTPKQWASQDRSGSNSALKARICPFYYITTKATVCPTPLHGTSWAQSKFKTANLILNCN